MTQFVTSYLAVSRNSSSSGKKMAEKVFKVLIKDIIFSNNYYTSITICTRFKDAGVIFHPF